MTIASCTDCHTPGHFLGKPDMTRHLGGSDIGFEIPRLGVFYGPNLTPDEATGLGRWSERDIVKAIRTGKRPDGRTLAPIMPRAAFANLTESDAGAIAAYLKSLPPVSNKVPGLFGQGEAPTSFVMKIVARRSNEVRSARSARQEDFFGRHSIAARTRLRQFLLLAAHDPVQQNQRTTKRDRYR